MNSEHRYVFDSNVVISALLFSSSVPGQVFLQSLKTGTVLISSALLEELHGVLSRDKFKRYVTPEERETFLAALIREAELVEIRQSVQACRDPKDDRILELAVCGLASHVVTGDNDLLVLHPFREISIVTPTALLELLKGSADE